MAALPIGAYFGIISGAALVALGAAAATVRPATVASRAFTAFAVIWGGSVTLANVGVLNGSFALATGSIALAAFVPPTLLLFVSTIGAAGASRAAIAAAGLLGVLALVIVGLLVAVPDVVLGDLSAAYAPLHYWVIAYWDSQGAFVAAWAVALWRFRRADGPVRPTLFLVATPLAIYVVNRTAVAGVYALTGPPAPAFAPGDLGFTAVNAFWVAAGAAVFVAHVRTMRAGTAGEPAARWSIALLSIAAALGLSEGIAWKLGFLDYGTWGIARLALVGLLAYAIARHRMFDIDLRLSNLAPGATYVVALVGLVALLFFALGEAFVAAPFFGVAAVVGSGMLVVPAARVGRVAVRRLAPHVGEPDYLFKRKLEVYRAALLEAQRTGSAEDDEFLRSLRRDLGITEREHRVLLLTLDTSAPRARAGPSVLGEKFRVERELGRGGFGKVLLARDAVLDRPVVLKQPTGMFARDESARQLFLQEARIAARLNHPNLVAIHQILDEEDPPVLVLEYVEGESLADRLQRPPRLTVAEVRSLARDVLAGLGELHRVGIVHRDVKPGNILVRTDGVAKLTDFGIAQAPSLRDAVTLAATGFQPGSLAYMSPEQARGERIDARSDLFSFGVVLHQAVAGRHVLDETPDHEWARRVAEPRGFPLPEDTPTDLRLVIERALAADPAARWASAEAMAAPLAEDSRPGST